MSLEALPNEILALVCDFISDQSDLCHLASVSKRLNEGVEPCLYAAIKITNADSNASLKLAVASRQRRAAAVRKLEIRRGKQQHDDDSEAKELDRNPSDSDIAWCSFFPNLQELFLRSSVWEAQNVRHEMEKVRLGTSLKRLKSCTLSYISNEHSVRDPHRIPDQRWNLELFWPIVVHPGLERLVINFANYNINQVDLQDVSDYRNSALRELHLISCDFGSGAFIKLFGISRSLEELTITLNDGTAASTLRVDFPTVLARASVGETLKKFTFLNWLPCDDLSPMIKFAGFKSLRHLTVMAGDIFGLLKAHRIHRVLTLIPEIIPPSLETLELAVYMHDTQGDLGGREKGIFKLLMELLRPKNKRLVPSLRRLIVARISRNLVVPDPVIEQCAALGLVLEMPTTMEWFVRDLLLREMYL